MMGEMQLRDDHDACESCGASVAESIADYERNELSICRSDGDMQCAMQVSQ